MGVKHFFYWLKNKFPECMKTIHRNSLLEVTIDNLYIDMNGIFHTAAQKSFEYGNYKPQARLLGNRNHPRKSYRELEELLYKEVAIQIEYYLNFCKPQKRLIMCVDGPAPLSKQNQQRQRRFRSASEQTENTRFDSTCISPGTKFMNNLTKYINWYIKKRITESLEWKKIEIIFSNEKVEGEGEAKCFKYIRNHGKNEESHCVIGNDADLIMLALSTQKPKMYIVREDMYNIENIFALDIGLLRNLLSKEMSWESEEYYYDGKQVIFDFIFLCFSLVMIFYRICQLSRLYKTE